MTVNRVMGLILSALACLLMPEAIAADKPEQGSGAHPPPRLQPGPEMIDPLSSQGKRIPSHQPEWTDHNSPDPGVTRNLPLDRRAGEIRFGDGASGRRPPAREGQASTYRHGGGKSSSPAATTGQTLKRQSTPRLKAAPDLPRMKKMPIRTGNKYQNDQNELRKKKQENMQQQADEFSQDNNLKEDSREQMKRAQQLLEESRERQTEAVRKLTSP